MSGVLVQLHGNASARAAKGGEKSMKFSVVGCVILTTGAIMASWPATAFLLQYFSNVQNTGALVAGGFFTLLSVVMWSSASWGWLKTFKAGKF